MGQILAVLEAMGELDNTLLIFTSDNGMNMGHHGIWGQGQRHLPIENMYDTSVKVPMLMALPGRLPQGQVDEHLLSHYDLMPTLLDYLGLGSSGARRRAAGSELCAASCGASRSMIASTWWSSTSTAWCA